MKDKIFHGPDVDIHYIEGPDHHEPILLLHGGSSRLQAFTPIFESIANDFHAYAIDARGHGQSRRAASYKIEDYANDVAAFISGCIKQPTIIFGNSFGGMVAILVAAHHPELVRAIILGDTPISHKTLRNLCDAQREFAQQIINNLQQNQMDNIYKIVNDDHFAESLTHCDPNMLDAMFNQFELTFAAYSPMQLFPLIQCPVLIIRGNIDRGSLISDEDLDQAKRLLAHVDEVKLANVGHSLMEDKNALLGAINEFKKVLKQK